MGVGIGKFLFYCVKNILATKCDVVGASLHLADCLLHYVPVTD